MRIEDVTVGQWVIYRPHHGRPEDGVVTAIRGTNVMVRYDGDRQAKATRAEDLTPGQTDGT